MKMTLAFVTTRYIKFNREIFNNELPHVNKITFQTSVSKRFGGQISHQYGTNHITFKFSTALTFQDVTTAEEVVIHEMIHIYQIVKRMIMGHNTSFKIQAEYIGIISKYRISTKLSADKLSSDKVKVYVIVYPHPTEEIKLYKCFHHTAQNYKKLSKTPYRLYEINIDESKMRYSKKIDGKVWYCEPSIITEIKNSKEI